MVGLTPPPPMIGSAMTSKPIYFDSLDNCAYFLGKAEHSARTSITPGVCSGSSADPDEPL